MSVRESSTYNTNKGIEEINEASYIYANQLLASSINENTFTKSAGTNLEKALGIFKQLSEYKDSWILAKKCQSLLSLSKEQRKNDIELVNYKPDLKNLVFGIVLILSGILLIIIGIIKILLVILLLGVLPVYLGINLIRNYKYNKKVYPELLLKQKSIMERLQHML